MFCLLWRWLKKTFDTWLQCCGSGSGRIRNFKEDTDLAKNYSGSEQLRIRNEFERIFIWKTGKMWQFLNKNAQLKKKQFLFVKEIRYSPKKLISRHNEQPNTLTRQEYKGKIYVKKIRTNLCRIQDRIQIRNQLKSMIRIRKKLFRIHNTAWLPGFELSGDCTVHVSRGVL